MAELPDPRELLELGDGQSATFRVVKWELGEAVIKPRHQPDGKDVPHLRIHVTAQDKAHFPYYWDVHAKTLVAQLRPQLERADVARLRFTVTARGVGEKKRFTVETQPA